MPGQISVRGLLGHRNFQFKEAPRKDDWQAFKENLATSSNPSDAETGSCCATKRDWSPLYVPNEEPKKREFFRVGAEDDSLIDTSVKDLSARGMEESFWLGE